MQGTTVCLLLLRLHAQTQFRVLSKYSRSTPSMPPRPQQHPALEQPASAQLQHPTVCPSLLHTIRLLNDSFLSPTADPLAAPDLWPPSVLRILLHQPWGQRWEPAPTCPSQGGDKAGQGGRRALCLPPSPAPARPRHCAGGAPVLTAGWPTVALVPRRHQGRSVQAARSTAVLRALHALCSPAQRSVHGAHQVVDVLLAVAGLQAEPMKAKIESKVHGRRLASALKGWRDVFSVQQQQLLSATNWSVPPRQQHMPPGLASVPGNAAAAHLAALDVVQWHVSPMPPQGSQSMQKRTSHMINQSTAAHLAALDVVQALLVNAALGGGQLEGPQEVVGLKRVEKKVDNRKAVRQEAVRQNAVVGLPEVGGTRQQEGGEAGRGEVRSSCWPVQSSMQAGRLGAACLFNAGVRIEMPCSPFPAPQGLPDSQRQRTSAPAQPEAVHRKRSCRAPA